MTRNLLHKGFIGTAVWLLCLLGSSGSVLAQCATSGSFTGSLRIKNSSGCVPLTVRTSSDLIGVRNVRYIYEYDGKNESRTVFDTVYTYKRPGLYQILQLSEKEGLPLRACGWVMVYDTVPPVFSLKSCLNTVQLSIPNAGAYQYDFFLVDWGDGRSDTLRVTQPVLSHSYSGSVSRRIRVQGSFQYVNCGGQSVQTFTPASAAQMPVIREIVRTAPQRLQLNLTNPGRARVLVQQKEADGSYTVIGTATDGTTVGVSVDNDTSQVTCFRLVLADSCLATNPSADVCYEPPVKLTLPVAEPADWFLPDAFTPNGDGLNDGFGLLGKLPAGLFRLTIFDRWGRVVFDTDDAARQWDGTLRGQPALGGMYLYRLELQETGRPRQQKNGSVFLIR